MRLAYMSLACLACVLTLGTAALPERVETRAENRKIGFGFPIDFIYIDRSWVWYGPGEWEPYVTHLSPEEYEDTFRLERFMVDWTIVALLLCAPVAIIRRRPPTRSRTSSSRD